MASKVRNVTVEAFLQKANVDVPGDTPAGPADRVALIRRATYTLTGLPPTQAEVEAFVRDPSADAFATVVDRLLASPRYGEHQARHWLEVACYGEDVNFTVGKEGIVNAWRFRDWVIDAFNGDLPYDRFVKYQIAADRGEWRSVACKAETLDDRVDTLTRGFLALTVS